LVIFVGFIATLSLLGIFDDFSFWAIKFGTGMLPKSQGQVSLPTLKQSIIAYLPYFVLIILVKIKKRKDLIVLIILVKIKKRKDLMLLSFWTIFLSLGAFPRWGLFHFQPALPFLSILGALIIYRLPKGKNLRNIVLITFVFLVLTLFSKVVYNDWNTSVISNNTDKEDKIYVLNAWDSVYALSSTLPAARPWIPHLSWYMELEGVQENIVKDLSQNNPKLIVIGRFTKEGLSSYKPDKIVEYIESNYAKETSIGNYNIYNPNK